MENSVEKFSLRSINTHIGIDPHWDYCCSNRVPYVRISQSGTKYWKVKYDILPLTMFERFVVIDYTDYTIPFYDQYCRDSNLTHSRQTYSGSGGCLMFTVYKEDATEFAEKLYDLLVVLSIKDKELFEKNPVYISTDGCNPEGFKIEKYVEDLKVISDQELIHQYNNMKTENPFWKNTIQLIENEIKKRKELTDLPVQELKKLSAKESADIYANTFLKNLNSQPKKK